MLEEKPNDFFSAPIPGQGLTNAVGGTPWEQPPQHVDLSETLEVVFDLLIDKSEDIVLLLKAGVEAEILANNILFGGFIKGRWTPDLAQLMSPIVLAQIVAIGKSKGAGMTIRGARKEEDKFKAKLVNLLGEDDIEEESVSDVEDAFTGLLGNG